MALALVIAGAALLGCRHRDPLAPFGVICLFTVAVLGVDVMTGSRLQLETPFGLSVLEAGRFYGIGNEALGIYGLSGLFGAAWLALVLLRRRTAWPPPAAGAVAAARGPGRRGGRGVHRVRVGLARVRRQGGRHHRHGALLPAAGHGVAGIRLNWRRVLLVAVSGLALFAVFALISYLVPATGHSDIGVFAGNTLHGRSGGLLLRKINSNLGSLSVNAFSPLIPIVAIVTGLMLWRPAWFRLTTAPLAFAAEPPMGRCCARCWACCG